MQEKKNSDIFIYYYPLTLTLPRGGYVPKKLRSEFMDFKDKMGKRLVSITPSVFVFAEKSID
jgi:hypothetical protein